MSINGDKIATEYEVRMEVTVRVTTDNAEVAEQIAHEWVAEGLDGTGSEVKTARVRHNWKPTAERLLAEGMSQAEVGRTIGLDRGTIHRAFPGTGWTIQKGVAFRKMQEQLDRLPNYLERQELGR